MEKKDIKVVKNLVSEGYKLKKQHFSPKWKKALEAGERLIDQLDEVSEHKTIENNIADVIASDSFRKDLEKSIEEGNDFGYNEDGGYDYFNKATAFEEVIKVVKKHLL